MEPNTITIPFAEAGATALRNVDFSNATQITKEGRPQIGDIILAHVTSIGDVKVLQNPNGREEDIHTGDLVMLAYGQRYAIAEYEAVLPDTLEECDLVSRGGVAAKVVNKNHKMGTPTRVQPRGFLRDANGQKLNTRQFSLAPERSLTTLNKPVVMAFLGTGMDAGKTTTACSTIHGLTRAGHKVGFGKVTGTGYSGDLFAPIDSGAVTGYDFVDMGYPSTYMVPTAQINRIMDDIINKLRLDGCDTIVLEIADGIFQQDNMQLLSSASVKARIDGIILAADGPLGAIQANQTMRDQGYEVLAISGVASAAPLALREIKRNLGNMSPPFGCLTKDDLRTPEIADGLRNSALASRDNKLRAAITAKLPKPDGADKRDAVLV